MKVYAVQPDLTWEDKEANFSRILSLVEKKKVHPGSLIVLPETFATGFSMNLPVTTEREPEKTESFLGNLAKRKKCWVTGGLVEPATDGQKGINRSVSFSPDGQKLCSYGKIHPAAFFGEDKVHNPGDRVEVFPLNDFMVCPLVCYDLRFPELFRIGMQKGANLFTVIACWPKARIDHWVSLLKARAIENQAYVVGVNRVGSDPKTEFGGRSLVIDPMGETLADAGRDESVAQAELDLNRLDAWREKFPVLKHTRPDFLPEIR
jgi:omega-amidase